MCLDFQVTLAAWQEFDSQQEAVQEFVNKASTTIDRDLNFSSPESLAVELDQANVSAFGEKLKQYIEADSFFSDRNRNILEISSKT